jgi:hypothetical protein
VAAETCIFLVKNPNEIFGRDHTSTPHSVYPEKRGRIVLYRQEVEEGKERGEVTCKRPSSGGGIGSGQRKTAGIPLNRKRRFNARDQCLLQQEENQTNSKGRNKIAHYKQTNKINNCVNLI